MIAPMVLDGLMTGVWFLAYVEQVLAPTLKPGDIVILDNLACHRSAAARRAIEAVGASSSSCRPAAQTSTRSRMPSQSSRPCSAGPPPAPETTSGRPSPRSSTRSRQTNAPTTPPQRDTIAGYDAG